VAAVFLNWRKKWLNCFSRFFYFSHWKRDCFLAVAQYTGFSNTEHSSASEMTYIVSGGALNSTHSLTLNMGKANVEDQSTIKVRNTWIEDDSNQNELHGARVIVGCVTTPQSAPKRAAWSLKNRLS